MHDSVAVRTVGVNGAVPICTVCVVLTVAIDVHGTVPVAVRLDDRGDAIAVGVDVNGTVPVAVRTIL